MNVFLSWSGERSLKAAEFLHEWLQYVVQSCVPWVSSSDIDRGSVWFTEISNRLKASDVGIICLTDENKTKPWILFEAGALAKGLEKNHVIPLLIGLETHEVAPSLSMFNMAKTTKEDMYKVVATLNGLSEKPLERATLKRAFEPHWPEFEAAIKAIIASTPATTTEPARSDKEILIELLNGMRGLQSRTTAVGPSLDDEDVADRVVTHRRRGLSWLRAVRRVADETGLPPVIVGRIANKFNVAGGPIGMLEAEAEAYGPLVREAAKQVAEKVIAEKRNPPDLTQPST